MHRALRCLLVLCWATSITACNNELFFSNPCTTATRFVAGGHSPSLHIPMDSLKKMASSSPTNLRQQSGLHRMPTQPNGVIGRPEFTRSADVAPRDANRPTEIPYAAHQAFADSLHNLPPDLAAFADTNNWCTAAIPEYQDAQRFIQPDSEVYGPLAQSLSNPALATWVAAAPFEAQFINVAVIHVMPQDGIKGLPYQNLHLIDGLNCVYIHHQTGNWVAKIAPPDGYRCDPNSPAVAAAAIIPVAPEDPGGDPRAIPPVTRFVQSDDKAALLGVRCGALWCNVGGLPASLPGSVLASAAPLPGPVRDKPQAKIKGWFDEQRVATDDPTRVPAVRPSMLAAIVPDPKLRTISISDYEARYQPVAYAYASDQNDKYVKGFGIGKGWSTISLKKTGTVWDAEIAGPAGTHHRRVYYTAHTLGSIPGTVRWDWMDYDEWIWISCGLGCCLIESGVGYGDES